MKTKGPTVKHQFLIIQIQKQAISMIQCSVLMMVRTAFNEEITLLPKVFGNNKPNSLVGVNWKLSIKSVTAKTRKILSFINLFSELTSNFLACYL